jgi:hypothetical protein
MGDTKKEKRVIELGTRRREMEMIGERRSKRKRDKKTERVNEEKRERNKCTEV